MSKMMTRGHNYVGSHLKEHAFHGSNISRSTDINQILKILQIEVIKHIVPDETGVWTLPRAADNKDGDQNRKEERQRRIRTKTSAISIHDAPSASSGRRPRAAARAPAKRRSMANAEAKADRVQQIYILTDLLPPITPPHHWSCSGPTVEIEGKRVSKLVDFFFLNSERTEILHDFNFFIKKK